MTPIKGDEVSIEPPSKQLQLAVNPNPNIYFNSSVKTPDLEFPTLAGLSKQIKDLSSDVKILISNNKHIKQKESNHQVEIQSDLTSDEKRSVISHACSLKSILKWLDD